VQVGEIHGAFNLSETHRFAAVGAEIRDKVGFGSAHGPVLLEIPSADGHLPFNIGKTIHQHQKSTIFQFGLEFTLGVALQIDLGDLPGESLDQPQAAVGHFHKVSRHVGFTGTLSLTAEGVQALAFG